MARVDHLEIAKRKAVDMYKLISISIVVILGLVALTQGVDVAFEWLVRIIQILIYPVSMGICVTLAIVGGISIAEKYNIFSFDDGYPIIILGGFGFFIWYISLPTIINFFDHFFS